MRADGGAPPPPLARGGDGGAGGAGGAGGGRVRWAAAAAAAESVDGATAPSPALPADPGDKADIFLIRTDGFTCTRETVQQATLRFLHPSTQQQLLMWKNPPRSVLVLKKLGPELLPHLVEVARYLGEEEGMRVVVEENVLHELDAAGLDLAYVTAFSRSEAPRLHRSIDFTVCLGGDGVILHASTLFAGAVPPVLSFGLGSLGFLTSHSFGAFRDEVRDVIHGNEKTMDGVFITLRMRLRCTVCRRGEPIPGMQYDVLNEVVVNRGISPYLSKIECYERDRLITKVQGDGVMISTPTGSTAYSVAAGGAMVHPNVPGILFTPICPHSLSFRPVILPDSAELELRIPDDARSTAWVTFDGKGIHELEHGMSVRIQMSEFPLPTFTKSDQTADWFGSLVRCLNWNERTEQRPLEEM